MTDLNLAQMPEVDICLYSIPISGPFFIMTFIIGVVITLVLLIMRRFRKIDILLFVISEGATILGHYRIHDDEFLEWIYHGGIGVHFATVSGVCAIIALSAHAIMWHHLLRKKTVKTSH